LAQPQDFVLDNGVYQTHPEGAHLSVQAYTQGSPETHGRPGIEIFAFTRPDFDSDEPNFHAVVDVGKLRPGKWHTFTDHNDLAIPFELFITTKGQWVGRWT
jgi:hypothetical protein